MTASPRTWILRRAILSLTFLAAVAPIAAAQRADGSQPDKANRSPSEIAALLDAYAAGRAQDALSLDEMHYPEFLARLQRLQAIRRRNQQVHRQLMQELRKLAGATVEPPYDEVAIRERLKALRDHDARAAQELARAHDGVDEVLDVRQQARFRLFEEMIERRKLDLVMRARNSAIARKRNIQP